MPTAKLILDDIPIRSGKLCRITLFEPEVHPELNVKVYGERTAVVVSLTDVATWALSRKKTVKEIAKALDELEQLTTEEFQRGGDRQVRELLAHLCGRKLT